MELLNDKRLTPTMERIRNGSVQMFRERNPDDRTFISKENADLILEHKTDRSMYAELIDGQWYWVTGCEECKGNPRNTARSYIECDKHNVCVCCGISRKDIEGSVWGGINGWTCNPCHEAEKMERRRAAFEKLNGEEPDTTYMDSIICPHCGSEAGSEGVHEPQSMECYVCEGEFYVEVNWTPDFSTTIEGERMKE